jgi:hypothetical protein
VKRSELEHVIRAAAIIAEDDEIVVVGSQAILGQFPDAPEDLLVSIEADVYPKNKPERADLIDGSIGEGSPFHQTFGYYAQGVGRETAVLPPGWESRLFTVTNPGMRGAKGLCLEIHDLVLSKLVAGREKDKSFARTAVQHGLVEAPLLRARLQETQLDERLRSAVAVRITRAFDGEDPEL